MFASIKKHVSVPLRDAIEKIDVFVTQLDEGLTIDVIWIVQYLLNHLLFQNGFAEKVIHHLVIIYDTDCAVSLAFQSVFWLTIE